MDAARHGRARGRAVRRAAQHPGDAKERGLLLAMPVEKSGQDEFDFQYGDDFGAHIEEFDPDFSKVLVRYNPDGDAEMNARQTERLKRLSDWLHEHDRKFLFELLVPAEDAPARAGRRRLRPLRRRAAPGADAARDRRVPGRRGRGGHLEDRGDRHPGGLRADRADRPSRRARRRGLRGARARRRRREGRPLAAPGRARRRATPASRSAARSGGTRSRASSTGTSSARTRPSRWPTTTAASCRSTTRRPSRRRRREHPAGSDLQAVSQAQGGRW